MNTCSWMLYKILQCKQRLFRMRRGTLFVECYILKYHNLTALNLSPFNDGKIVGNTFFDEIATSGWQNDVLTLVICKPVKISKTYFTLMVGWELMLFLHFAGEHLMSKYVSIVHDYCYTSTLIKFLRWSPWHRFVQPLSHWRTLDAKVRSKKSFSHCAGLF